MNNEQEKKTVTVTTTMRTFNYVCNKILSTDAIQDTVQRMYPNEHFMDNKGKAFYYLKNQN